MDSVQIPCPRCEDGTATVIAVSPVPLVWQIYQCATCLYCWRSTEPARRTDRASYPREFRLTRAGIDGARDVPAIPPLRQQP
ncbi:non-oxidative hydroxyarylic acid decarboxylases subunit D [Mycobacteroides immunogenum]|nr:non-oxidative hydroxyarylic acid decarboxylases subunit D [Mycobacteroides immunogenum]WJR36390.1 non-oxidative hydroxyarylic acid decarboxylases subunit D [Mycobacteroides immunogenum]